MNDRNSLNLDEQQRQAQEAVRSLDRPKAAVDYRTRLKQQFVCGEIPETELGDLAETAAQVDSKEDDSHFFNRERLENQQLGRPWLGWAALATAAVLAALVLGFNHLPGPELVATNGVGTVTIRNEELAATNTGGINRALRAGVRVQVGTDSSIDIVYPGSFVLRAGPGSDLVLPSRPGRWFNRIVELPMSYGELSVRTGPKLAGGSLIVSTAEGRAVIYGTLVSVLRDENVTCVCLFEGSTDILTEFASLGAIPQGKRWVLFRDGSKPQLLDLVPEHLDHMLGLDEACANVFDLPVSH